ncbi:MAG TPA: cytochrome c, partial [Myxococcaceae bacterium]|nr:cytochrome c [Myxococcaceae bacterium]
MPSLIIGVASVCVFFGAQQILDQNLQPDSLGDNRTLSALEAPSASAATAGGAVDGAAVYTARCAACHQANGAGVPGAFPPLAASEWVKGADTALVDIVLHGVQGPLKVGGASYSGQMPGLKAQLSDAEIAAVTSHIRTQWGNSGAPITADSVKARRTATASRTAP